MKDEQYLRSKEFIQYMDQLDTYDNKLMTLLAVEEQLEKNVKESFCVFQYQWIHSIFPNGKEELYTKLKENGQIQLNATSYDEKLIQALGMLVGYRKMNDILRTLYKQFHRNIRSNLSNAASLKKSGLLWMFEKDKQKAIQAGNELYRIDKGFISNIDQLEKNYFNLSSYDAISDFKSDEDTYCQLLNSLVGNKVYCQQDPQIPNFVEMNEGIETLEDNTNEIQAILKKDKKQVGDIIGIVEYLQKEACMDDLKTISIDEIKRYASGIRINALKQEGMETIQDLIKASVIQLSQINGISEEGAYRIKEIANQILKDLKTNVKIQLNPEQRNQFTDSLVKNVAEYRQRKDCFEQAKQFDQEFRGMDTDLAILKNGNSKLSWYMSSIEQKEQIHEAVTHMKDVLDCSYNEQANQIVQAFKEFQDQDVDTAWKTFNEKAADFYAILDTLNPGLFASEDSYYGLPESLAKQIEQESLFPNGLLVTLRRYQEWGVKYILHQKRVLLGDEMGLGKTIQAIACMVSLKNTGATHFMVICPLSVLINWCREIETRSRLDVVKIHGQARESAIKEWLQNGGVAVTTYETTGFMKLPDDFNYSMLVVDEAHYIKNPEARRSQNVIEISKKAERMLFMTGTALENNVDEMVKLINDLQPDVAKQIEHIKHLSSADGFKEKVAPVYYRRKREDVLTELPELIEKQQWCELLPQEKEIYEQSVKEKKYAQARRVSWNVEDYTQSSKALRLKEIIAQAKEENRKVIVFSFFLETIQKLKSFLGDICSIPITGSIQPEIRQSIIDEFNQAKAGSVLLAQIVAGGTGLNIQAASVIVICEPQFKPSIENQAISRAYRMGQTRSVLVHRLLCVKTIDEKISKLLEQKQTVFDAFADESISAKESLQLDQSTFVNMIEEEIKRISSENEKNG